MSFKKIIALSVALSHILTISSLPSAYADFDEDTKIILEAISDEPDPFSVPVAGQAVLTGQFTVHIDDDFDDDSDDSRQKFFVKHRIRILDADTKEKIVVLRGKTKVPLPNQDNDDDDDEDDEGHIVQITAIQDWDGRDTNGILAPDGNYIYKFIGKLIRVNRGGDDDDDEDGGRRKVIAKSNRLKGSILIDNTPPVISNITPADGSTTSDSRPAISADYNDATSGIDTTSIVLKLDGLDITAQSMINPGSISFTPTSDLTDGPHTIMVQVTDLAGNIANAQSVFTVLPSVQPLSLDPIGDQSVDVGTTLTLNLTASGGTAPIAFSASPLPLPANTSLNATTGVFIFTPTPEQVGSFDLIFSVSDKTASDSEGVTIFVEELPGITTLQGFVRITDSQPLANVRLVLGLDNPVEVFSQADGSFFFSNIPFSGQQRLLIDGSTVNPALGTFATVPETITLIEGANNVLQPDIFLLPLDVASGDPIDPAIESIITSSPIQSNGQIFEEVSLTVAAGSATSETTGQLFSGNVFITNIDDPTMGPRPLPDDLDLSVYIAIQPFGVRYNPPAPIAFPNVDGFPEGSLVDIFGLNHDTGVFEIVGQGRVEADNMVHSIGGVVTDNSWHGFVGLEPDLSKGKDTDEEIKGNGDICTDLGSDVCIQSGDLIVSHETVSYRSVGVSRSTKLIYQSANANPLPIITIESALQPFGAPPELASMEIRVAGIDQGQELFTQIDLTTDPLRPAVQFDAQMFPSGVYPYNFALNCFFQASRRTGNLGGEIIIRNEINSPFGAGWTLGEVQKLLIQPNGDALITEGDGSAIVFTQVPAGISTFSDPTNFLVGSNPHSLAAGDFNEDTVLDLIVANQTGSNISLLLGDGAGGFSGPTNFPAGSFPESLAVGDFNGDTTLDLAVGVAFNNIVSIFLGDGAGGFSGPTNFLVGDRPLSVALGDFNGDTIVDLVTANFSSDNVSILFGDGLGEFSSPTNLPADDPTSVAVGNFNGDTNLDLVVANFRGNNVSIFLGDGTGGFSGPTNFPAGTRQRFVAVEDLNGDTVLDLAVTNEISASVSILLGNGVGGFSAPQAFPVGFRPYSVVAGDFNGDTVLDLAVANRDSFTISILLGDGFGGFSGSTDFLVGASPESLAVGDFNKDTALDLAVSNFNSNNVSVLLGAPIGLTKFENPAGEFSTLGKNADDTFTRTMKDGTQIHFDVNGLQTSIVDRNGNTTTYTYDAQDRIDTITDPAGLNTTFTYTGGLLSSITNPAGRTTIFDHDTESNLTRIIDPDGTERLFNYDTNHRLTSQTNKRGFETTYDYDLAGRVIQANRPEGSTRQAASSQVIGLIDTSTGLGTRENPAPAPPLLSSVMASFTDGNNHQTTFTTDGIGKIVKMTDALNRSMIIDRDENSNPTQITQANAAVIAMTYDERGNLLTINDQSISATTTFTYETSFNQVSSIQDPELNTTTINYDANGNAIEIIDAAGTITKMEYTDTNCPGQLTKIINAQGLPEENMTSFAYDPVTCNLTATTDPNGFTTTLTYDTAGNVKASTDGEGKVTEFFYDNMNRLTQVKDADFKNTFYTYDEAGNLKTVTDANSNTTAFDYDEANRLVKRTDPLGKFETFDYDGNGNLIQVIDRKLQTIDFEYDAVDQLTKKILPGPLETVFDYDEVGNLTSVVDPDSVLTFDYDGTSRLIQAKTTGSPNQPDVTIDYTYDRNSNRKTMIDGSGTTTYFYDALNRLASLTNPASQTVSFGYDAFNRKTSITMPNGITTSLMYDAASQLMDLTHKLGATTLSSFGYTYDKVGNRITMSTSRTGVAINTNLGYIYDNLYQLTQATNSLPLQPDETFAYDALGNRDPLTSTYDNANRLLNDGTNTYAYDDNGNLIQKVAPALTTDYIYDAENQLIEIKENTATIAQYLYDGLRRRIEKDVGGTITRYIYDNEDILLEYDGANVLQASYTHGVGIDEPLIMERGGSSFFYHTDGLGSITDLTDNLGAVIQSYVYDSFGNIVTQVGTLPNPYTYTGREFDSESGLYYYRARYYDPNIGRFLQHDPRGSVNDRNLFTYVGNNPINFVDFDGQQRMRIIGGVINLTCKLFPNDCFPPQPPQPGNPDFIGPINVTDRAREALDELAALIRLRKSLLKNGCSNLTEELTNIDKNIKIYKDIINDLKRKGQFYDINPTPVAL